MSCRRGPRHARVSNATATECAARGFVSFSFGYPIRGRLASRRNADGRVARLQRTSGRRMTCWHGSRRTEMLRAGPGEAGRYRGGRPVRRPWETSAVKMRRCCASIAQSLCGLAWLRRRCGPHGGAGQWMAARKGAGARPQLSQGLMVVSYFGVFFSMLMTTADFTALWSSSMVMTPLTP